MRADPPIRLLSERDVRAIGLSLAETIALIEQVYLLDAQGGVEVPMKIGVHPLEPDNILHAMPAWIEGARALGMKWVSYFPGNARRGLADYSGIIILNDADSRAAPVHHGRNACHLRAHRRLRHCRGQAYSCGTSKEPWVDWMWPAGALDLTNDA